jgi:hypothetical protein
MSPPCRENGEIVSNRVHFCFHAGRAKARTASLPLQTPSARTLSPARTCHQGAAIKLRQRGPTMADKSQKMLARLPRGFVDRHADDIRAVELMMSRIKAVYELYGFEPADQPLIEYTDALGKFLPDQDRPNEGVFSFQDDDEQWLSLRYDLTAPMARNTVIRRTSFSVPATPMASSTPSRTLRLLTFIT